MNYFAYLDTDERSKRYDWKDSGYQEPDFSGSEMSGMHHYSVELGIFRLGWRKAKKVRKQQRGENMVLRPPDLNPHRVA
jgi:hypothetical protein